MKKICAWCGKDLGPAENSSDSERITHGICSDCRFNIMKFKNRSIADILNSIAEPVLLVDADGKVKAANKKASEVLNKKIPDIEDHLSGDVFECEYSKERGGCGKTIYCKACPIHNIVMETLKTGENSLKIPAFKRIKTETGYKKMEIVISTEKSGEHVLLRIDGSSESTF